MDPQLKREPLGNGFEIYVSDHHTFGTDAVLLADFASAKIRKKDFGFAIRILFQRLKPFWKGSTCLFK